MSAENTESGALLNSPLQQRHLAAGAKFAPFSGWSMPLEYAGAGVLAEHAAVRNAVGIFDVSHLGKATVAGPGAADYVNRCLTADLRKIGPGQAQYTLLCNPDGGVVDDMIAYLRSPDELFLIPNAANCALVVTLEPCSMCAGAIVNARIPKLIYGCDDPKAGAVNTLYNICRDERLNHQVEVVAGVKAEECSGLLQEFFKRQRALGKK